MGQHSTSGRRRSTAGAGVPDRRAGGVDDDARPPHPRGHVRAGRRHRQLAAVDRDGLGKGGDAERGPLLRGRARRARHLGQCGQPEPHEDSVLNTLPDEAVQLARDWHRRWTPMGRLGTPADIGTSCRCSDEASFIAGLIMSKSSSSGACSISIVSMTTK